MRGLCPEKDVGMSVSGTMTKRRRRSFSPEFKAEIVRSASCPVTRSPRYARTTTWPSRRCAAGQPSRGGCWSQAGGDRRRSGRDRPVAQAVAGGDRGARHSRSGRGFLCQGDTMTVQRRAFVEAEKTAGRNVAQACELLEVSRSAFYTWCYVSSAPCQRQDGGSCALVGSQTPPAQRDGSGGVKKPRAVVGSPTYCWASPGPRHERDERLP